MGDDQRPETDAPPKLTVSQRILTALPRLGGPPSGGRRDHGSGAGAGAGTEQGTDRGTDRRASTAAGASGGTETAAEDVPDTRDHEDAGGEVTRTSVAPRSKEPTSASGKTKEELAHSIKYVDDRERRIGLFMAPLGAAIGIALVVVGFRTHQAQHLAKGQTPRDTIITLGFVAIALSVVVLLAAMSRRRAFLGFALVFLGIPLNFPLLLPFWFVGGWLVFRSLKWQRELAAMGRAGAAARGAGRRRAGRGAESGRSAGSGRGATGRGGSARQDPRARARDAAAARAAKRQPAAKGPTPSKRYTPPKPTRPRPPASSS